MRSYKEPITKEKKNTLWKAIFILLLIVNILFISWAFFTWSQYQISSYPGDWSVFIVIILSFPLVSIDLITILIYLYIRIPHSPAKVISYSYILIFLGPLFMVSIVFIGGHFITYHVTETIRKIPLSRDEAIMLINDCRVSAIRRASHTKKYTEIIVKELNQERYIVRPVADSDSNYEALLRTAQSASSHCGTIGTSLTLPNRYQLRNGHVYHKGYLIEEADYNTFEYVGDGYAKDATHVYYEGVIVPNVDPASCILESLLQCQSH